jgi:hypothetical protein
MTPVMKSHGIPIFDVAAVKTIPKIVQLTKWLNFNENELEFIASEYRRIDKDRARTCVIAYNHGRIALFVNDLTNGAFERDGKE